MRLVGPDANGRCQSVGQKIFQCSSSLTWGRTSYPANEVRSFRCGGDSLAAAQSHRLLQPQQDKPAGQGWLEICRNVASLPDLLVLATRRSFHCLTSLMKWPVFNTHTVINIRSSTYLICLNILIRSSDQDVLLYYA